MNTPLLRKFLSKITTISIPVLIALIFAGSSAIYAKKNPNDPTNQPHDYTEFVCGTRTDHALHSRAKMIHAENLKRISDLQLISSVTADFDEGDVAVMVDDGILIIPAASNAVDLDGLTLLFTPNDSGGYDVDTVTFTFDLVLGTNVGAGDDTNHEFDLTGGFSFPFFESTWTNIWVRSNGNVTFGAIGNPNFFDPFDFSLELPMIAAFFGDLDPSVTGGVFVKEDATRFTVTWNAVPEFDVSNSNTLQLVLNDDGSFQVSYDGLGISTPANGSLVVGFNSGRSNATVQAVDFSAGSIDGSSSDKLFELFKPMDPLPVIDEIAIFNKFYETHDDIYDQIIIMPDFNHFNGIATGAFAFHMGISNSVRGIHRELFDFSADFGSAGRLKSYLWMNELDAWPDDPSVRSVQFPGDPDKFLTVMAQEAGHRWLSFLRFDQGGGVSDLLLGSALAHWSSYLSFEVTSTMSGGNNWIEISPNLFEVRAELDYFSNLDQYAIGLRAPEEVPPFFYISSASNNTLANRSQSTFIPGTSATGTRVEVTIEDIIAAEGTRLPARSSSQKDFQQAFILLVQQGTLPSDADLNKMKNFVAEWKDYWVAATDGRSTLSTNLDTVLDVAAVEGIVTDASTSQPIGNILATNLATGVDQTVASGGYYTWRTLADSVGEPNRTFTQIISAYPYIPDTSEVAVTFNSTITQDITLTYLPTSSLAGTITNSVSGAAVEAQVVLHVFNEVIGPFDIEVFTDGSGGYSFTDLFITFPGIVSYEGITVYPDFPNIATEYEETVVITEGVVATVDIAVEVGDILLVNDDPNGTHSKFYTDVLDDQNITYHQWFTAEKGVAPAPAAATETGYPIIIWFTGDEVTNSISASEEDSLIAFLDAGGRLFLTGQNIVENFSSSSPLLTNYLQVFHGGNSTSILTSSIDGNPVTGGDKLYGITGGGGANNQNSKDIFLPLGLATDAMIYGLSGTDVAAVTVDDGNYKIFLMGFGFEGLIPGSNSLTSPDQLMFRALTWFGVPGLVSVEDEIAASVPKEFSLGQNYPNPFNPETSIIYTIPQDAYVRLTVYNILGQKVTTLVNEQISSGIQSVKWNGTSDNGSQVASGLYFYRIEARHANNGNQRIFVDAKKMLLLK